MWTFEYVSNLKEMVNSKMDDSLSIHFESIDIDRDEHSKEEEPVNIEIGSGKFKDLIKSYKT